MLQVGNGMSLNEDRAHFSIWAMLSAPLFAGNDIRSMSQETHDILTNSEVIAVNQDALAIQAFRYLKDGDMETWFKPMADDKWAVMFLNRGKENIDIDFVWKEHKVVDEVFSKELDFSNSTFTLRDVWKKKDLGKTNKKLKASVPASDVLMLILSPAK